MRDGQRGLLLIGGLAAALVGFIALRGAQAQPPPDGDLQLVAVGTPVIQ